MNNISNQLIKNAKFCPRPFTDLVLWYDKTYKPCCVYEDDQSTAQTDIDIEKIFSSNKFNEIRKKFLHLNDRLPKECGRCERGENRGEVSLRQILTTKLSDKNKNIFINADTGNLFGIPLKIEWRIGNSCNMSCRMCFPMVSSSIANEYINNKELFDAQPWQKEYKVYTLDHVSKNEVGKTVEVTGVSDWLDEKTIDDIAKKYRENYEQIKKIISNDSLFPMWNIIGGEPTVIPGFYTIIDKIKKYNIEDLIHLCITTNGLVFNKKLINSLKNIRTLEMVISLDGTKDVHEYIRYKRGYNKILKNIEEYKKITNVIVLISTVSILNIFDIPDWCNFLEKTGLSQSSHFQLVENPDLNPFTLPLSIRKEIKPKLQKAYDKMRFKPENLQAIIANLDQEKLPNSYSSDHNKKLKIFVERTLFLDKIRNQNILSIDSHGYFKRIINMVKNGN